MLAVLAVTCIITVPVGDDVDAPGDPGAVEVEVTMQAAPPECDRPKRKLGGNGMGVLPATPTSGRLVVTIGDGLTKPPRRVKRPRR